MVGARVGGGIGQSGVSWGRSSVWEDEKVLEISGGNGCTTM